MSDFGYFSGDDITLGGEPDPGSGLNDREIERELAELERATATLHGRTSDGVLREAPTGDVGTGQVRILRKRSGYTNINKGRTRKTDLANGRDAGNAQTSGDVADGAGANRPATRSLSELVESVGGGVPGSSGRVAPKRIRRKGLDGPIPLRTRELELRSVTQTVISGEFDRAEFNAVLKDIRFNTAGEAELKFVISFEDDLEAIKFRRAYGIDIHFIATRRTYDDVS